MEHKLIESIESAIEGMFEQFREKPNTPAALQKLNEECAKYVQKRLIETARIAFDAHRGCISIEDGIPFDILVFLPLCGLGVSERGSYTVMQGLKEVGYVSYNGMPEQSWSDAVMVGAETHFIPKEEVLMVYAEFGPLPG